MTQIFVFLISDKYSLVLTQHRMFSTQFAFLYSIYSNYYPMMTLDVLCHEVGHGVTSWKGGNMEYWGESGAMNEAYSDILGNSLTQDQRTCNSKTVP